MEPSQFILDDAFRAAAQKNMMLRGFMESVEDTIARNGLSKKAMRDAAERERAAKG